GRNFLYQDSLMMWTGIPAMTADGHILLSGQFANYNISPSRTSGGFCMKTDVQGNVIWSKLYDSSFHLGYDFINYFRVIELSNKDILLAGRTDNQYSRNADVIITRTDSTGNIIWTKTYQSRLWLGFNGSGDSFGFTDLKEDPANGDLFFVGNHWFSCVAVTKLNPATGSVVWSNAYDTYDSDYAFGLIINQGSMHLFQLGNGYYNQSRINITGINKSTGDSLFHKTYEQTGPTNTPRLYNVHQVQQLDNGHYLLAGPTTGYWEFPAFTGTKDLHHAGVIEFDQNFNYVTSYGFKNRVESNGYNTRVSFSKEGNGFFTMFDYISGYTGEALIALFRNKQIYHQRKRLHNNEGIPNETQMLSLSNGGFIGVKTMGDSARLAKDGSRVEYYRIHSSDTTSVCLGIKDSSTAFWNFSFTPVTYKLDSIRRNLFSESRVKTHVNFPFRTYTSPSCQVISHCDSLSVSSTSTVVCPGNTVTITVHKNKACGSNVPLSYDTTWITQVNRLNDSTWTFVMNNIGEGFIKASLMGCVMKEDSVR
ncbi:MAG TPA: hypothetical protein VGB71_08765, partial [Flavisolibacter sp.]